MASEQITTGKSDYIRLRHILKLENERHGLSEDTGEIKILDRMVSDFRSEITRLRAEIEAAPHTRGCHIWQIAGGGLSEKYCTCWKSTALKKGNDGE